MRRHLQHTSNFSDVAEKVLLLEPSEVPVAKVGNQVALDHLICQRVRARLQSGCVGLQPLPKGCVAGNRLGLIGIVDPSYESRVDLFGDPLRAALVGPRWTDPSDSALALVVNENPPGALPLPDLRRH